MRMNRGHDNYNEKKKLLIIEQILLVRTGNTQRKNGEYAYMLMLECKELKQTIPNACV